VLASGREAFKFSAGVAFGQNANEILDARMLESVMHARLDDRLDVVRAQSGKPRVEMRNCDAHDGRLVRLVYLHRYTDTRRVRRSGEQDVKGSASHHLSPRAREGHRRAITAFGSLAGWTSGGFGVTLMGQPLPADGPAARPTHLREGDPDAPGQGSS